jgi:hypothetical protein
MNLTKKNYFYKAFGLSISSEVSLPELIHINPFEKQIDIEIKLSDLNSFSQALDRAPLKYLIQDNKFYFKVPGAAIFCIQKGSEISVSPFDGYDQDELRLYLLGTCMGAILLQRKVLPLHGSAISINGKAYAFIGDSGAGKSTLARSLVKKGYQLLTDDVIALNLSNENNALITPSYPQQKLWEESLNNLGMDYSTFNPIYKREKKFAVPLKSMFLNEEIKLSGIFELNISEDHKVIVNEIHNLERFHTLLRNTYRYFLLSDFGLLEWHLTICSKFINKVKIYQIRRPIEGFSVDEITDQILKTVKKEG